MGNPNLGIFITLPRNVLNRMIMFTAYCTDLKILHPTSVFRCFVHEMGKRFESNRLQLNLAKMQVIRFGSTETQFASLHMGSSVHMRLMPHHGRFLVLTIDRNMNWKKHVEIAIIKS